MVPPQYPPQQCQVKIDNLWIEIRQSQADMLIRNSYTSPSLPFRLELNCNCNPVTFFPHPLSCPDSNWEQVEKKTKVQLDCWLFFFCLWSLHNVATHNLNIYLQTEQSIYIVYIPIAHSPSPRRHGTAHFAKQPLARSVLDRIRLGLHWVSPKSWRWTWLVIVLCAANDNCSASDTALSCAVPLS